MIKVNILLDNANISTQGMYTMVNMSTVNVLLQINHLSNQSNHCNVKTESCINMMGSLLNISIITKSISRNMAYS